MSLIHNYLESENNLAVKISEKPHPDLFYTVVIPCFNEDNLKATLESLYQADKPPQPIEVIIVINSAVSDPEEAKQRNKATLEEVTLWSRKHNNNTLKFIPVFLENLPDKKAGPGMARKTGMDTAICRLSKTSQPLGYILSLDADCLVAKNYFTAIEKALFSYPGLNAGILYFEHPTEGTEYKAENYLAVAQYELYLRYYNQGLSFCGFPYPFHTIGSAFLVSTEAYVKQGGMNSRKAGEDFYFLNKIFQLGKVVEINETCVFPSPRPSDRVLFGTGPEVKKLSAKKAESYKVYNPHYFLELKTFFQTLLPSLFHSEQPMELVNKIPDDLHNFLITINFEKELERLKSNCSNLRTFRKQFFHWFHGLKVIQFMHYVHDREDRKIMVSDAARKMLTMKGIPCNSSDIFHLLNAYRKLERSVQEKID